MGCVTVYLTDGCHFFKRLLKNLFWEIEEGREETMWERKSMGCLLQVPRWGLSLQLGHVPWPRIEPATLQCMGRHPTIESHQPGQIESHAKQLSEMLTNQTGESTAKWVECKQVLWQNGKNIKPEMTLYSLLQNAQESSSTFGLLGTNSQHLRWRGQFLPLGQGM